MPGIWDPSRSHLRVVLRDVVTEVRVGLHPWEQHAERPTRVIVNVEMFAPVGQGFGARKTKRGCVNYDLIHAALRSWPAKPHTGLLETLLHELVTLCFVSPRVAACRVSILKPDIFNDAAAVGVGGLCAAP